MEGNEGECNPAQHDNDEGERDPTQLDKEEEGECDTTQRDNEEEGECEPTRCDEEDDKGVCDQAQHKEECQCDSTSQRRNRPVQLIVDTSRGK